MGASKPKAAKPKEPENRKPGAENSKPKTEDVVEFVDLEERPLEEKLKNKPKKDEDEDYASAEGWKTD